MRSTNASLWCRSNSSQVLSVLGSIRSTTSIAVEVVTLVLVGAGGETAQDPFGDRRPNRSVYLNAEVDGANQLTAEMERTGIPR